MISLRSSVGRASSPGANVAKSRRRCGQLECAAKVLCGGARTHRESQVGECQPQLSDPVTPKSVGDRLPARPPRRLHGGPAVCLLPTGAAALTARAACVATSRGGCAVPTTIRCTCLCGARALTCRSLGAQSRSPGAPCRPPSLAARFALGETQRRRVGTRHSVDRAAWDNSSSRVG